jgi:hypothetical protein
LPQSPSKFSLLLLLLPLLISQTENKKEKPLTHKMENNQSFYNNYIFVVAEKTKNRVKLETINCTKSVIRFELSESYGRKKARIEE